jgi:hypothetical protein
MNARVAFRARGIVLPDIQSPLGLAANMVWVEMLRRERELETAKLMHDVMKTYAMAGMPESIPFNDRYAHIAPLTKNALAQIDQSAYGTDYSKRRLLTKRKVLADKRKQMTLLDRVTAPGFSLKAWVSGAYHEDDDG